MPQGPMTYLLDPRKPKLNTASARSSVPRSQLTVQSETGFRTLKPRREEDSGSLRGFLGFRSVKVTSCCHLAPCSISTLVVSATVLSRWPGRTLHPPLRGQDQKVGEDKGHEGNPTPDLGTKIQAVKTNLFRSLQQILDTLINHNLLHIISL